MDTFLLQYADLTAILLALSCTTIFAVYVQRPGHGSTRGWSAWLMGFGPCTISVLMFFHLFEISYRAIVAALHGAFVYTFHFYSLILFGLLMMIAALLLLVTCYRFARERRNLRALIRLIIFLVVLTLPLLPITPISIAPLIGVSTTLIGIHFLHTKRHEMSVRVQTERAA